MLRLPTLALALALLAPSAPAADERLSLEELLARFRERRDELLTNLSQEVTLALADLEAAAAAGQPGAVQEGFDELIALGAPCAPLLVRSIDPGPGATDAQRVRARTVTRVLREFRSPAVTGELLAILGRGSREGRRNALRALARAKDVDRVGAALRAHYAEAKGEERLETLSALAELGGGENERFLAELLGAEDREVATYALRALAQGGNAGASGQVLVLARNTASAAPLVPAILEFYRAVPEAVDDDACEALLALVQSKRPSGDHCVAILELLADFEREWPSSMKRHVKDLVESSSRDVAEAALVTLARTGDRSARKTLLESYDQRVKDQPNWANVWEERGDVLYRIGDYRDALRDYAEALRVGRDGGRYQGPVHVQMARCYAKLGKLKEAAEKLEKAPITLAERRGLATDPAFAELLASTRYREVFRLEE